MKLTFASGGPPERTGVTMRMAQPIKSGTRPGGGSAIAIWIIAILMSMAFLRTASQLLIPIVLSVLVSYALEPVVAWLERHRVTRLAGATALLALILGIATWTAYSLRDDADRALEALPRVAERVRAIVWSDMASNPARQVQRAAEALQGPAVPETDNSAGTRADSPRAATGASASEWLQWGVGSALALAGHVTVIVFLVFFLLVSGGHFRKRIVEIAGAPLERRQVTATIVDDINAQIQRFLLVRLVTSIVVALATWAVLAWMGVAQAAVWGVLAGVFNSIPYFGPILVSGGLFAVGLAQANDLLFAVKMAGAALVITSLEGWLLTPPLIGRAQRMHVVVVFLGVLLWTWIWGAWGTLLAVPMLVILKSVADHVDSLKPVGRLMAP
jgi:predicted PurR-regulated permease PerM